MKELNDMNKEEMKQYRKEVRSAIKNRDWDKYKELQKPNMARFKSDMKKSTDGIKKGITELKEGLNELSKNVEPKSSSQVVKTYNNTYQFKKDSRRMLKDGWKIVSQTSHKENFSISRGCLFGFIFLPLIIFGRGKSNIIVTYERIN